MFRAEEWVGRAEVFWRAQMLGNVKRIPPEACQELIVIRKNIFKA